MTRRRRLALLAGLAAAAAAVCGLTGLFPQEPLRALLERSLRRGFGDASRVGALHVVPARLRAEIEGVSLASPTLHFSARRVTLALAPSSLLGGLPTLSHVTVDHPTLVVRSSGGGGGGVARLPLLVRDLRIDDGTVVYEDADIGQITLPAVDVSGSVGTGPLSVTTGEGSWSRKPALPVGPIEARLRLTPLLSIDLDSLTLRSGSTWLRARGGLGRLGALSPHLDLDGEGHLEGLARGLALPESRGAFTVSGRVEGGSGALRASGVVEGRSLGLGPWAADAVTMAVAYETGRSPHATASLDVRTLGGHLGGRAELRGSQIDADLQAERIDLARAGPLAGLEGAAGLASGNLRIGGDVEGAVAIRSHVEASGSLDAMGGAASADVEGRVWLQRRFVDLDWEASLDAASDAEGASRSRIDRLHATASGTAHGEGTPDVNGRLEGEARVRTAAGLRQVPVAATLAMQRGRGTLTLEAQGLGGPVHAGAQIENAALVHLSVEGRGVDLSLLDPSTSGALSFQISSSGPLGRPEATGTATVERLAWRGVDVGAGTAHLEASAGLARLGATLPALNLRVDATAPVSGHGTLAGTLHADASPLGRLAPLVAPRSLTGALTGHVDFDVPLDRPDALHAAVAVDRLDVASGAFSTEALRPFTLDVTTRQVAISDLSLRGPGYGLEAEGSVGVGEADPVSLRLVLTGDAASLPVPEGWRIAGQVDGRVEVSGSRRAPVVRGDVHGRDVEARLPSGPALSSPVLRLSLDGDRVVVPPAQVAMDGGTATLSATFPLGSLLQAEVEPAACQAAELDVAWQRVDVAKLLGTLVPPDAGAAAALTGRLAMTGCPLDPRTLQGALHLDEAVLRSGELSVNLSPVDLRLETGRLSTPGITLWTQEGSLEVGGTVDLTHRRLAVYSNGRLALRALSPLVETAAFSGNADVSLAVAGPFDNPRPSGSVWLRDVGIRVRDVPDALTGVNGTVSIEGTRLTIEETRASLGGGTVTLSGGAQIRGAALSDVDVRIAGSDLALRYPAGLRTRLNGDLALTGRSGALKLGGTVNVVRGLYDLDAAMQQTAAVPVATPTPSPLLRSVALDIRAALDNPIMARSRMASLDVSGALRFQGTLETPEPLGRLDIRQGGRIYVLNREFTTQSGGLVYEGSWNPTVALRASVRIRGDDLREHEVYLVAEGPLETLSPRIEGSDISTAQALNLVATGHLGGGALGSTGDREANRKTLETGAALAGGEAASQLFGRVSQSLGLSPVSIQPELLARDTDPGARFTFGTQLTSIVSLIYSVGLAGPEERFVLVEVRPYRGVSLTGQRSDDGIVTVGAGQRLRFGGGHGGRERAEPRTTLEGVRFEGDLPVPEAELRAVARARVGKKVTAWTVQDDADRLRAHLTRSLFLEAEVSGRLDGAEAVFQVRAGPRFDWRVTGMADPPDLRKTIASALFEEDALDRGRESLLKALRDRGFLRARVDARAVEGEKGGRILSFDASPGPELEADVRFPGATTLSRDALVRAAGGAGVILTAPDRAVAGIRQAYRAANRLQARVGQPEVRDSDHRVTVAIPVDEGPAARVASVAFDGVSALAQPEVASAAGLAEGTLFDAGLPPAATERVRALYFSRGYPHVRISPDVRQSGADVSVTFHVDEGGQVHVGRVTIEGLGGTRESLVRGQITLAPGDPLDPRRLAETERRILELGIFSQAVVTASDDNPAQIHVALREKARVVATYNVRYNKVDRVMGLLDAEVRNLFGVGLTAGGRYVVGADVREKRASLFLPSLFGAGGVTASTFQLDEDFESVDPFTGESFTDVHTQKGFQVQQSVRLPDLWHGLFGYQWSRSSTTLLPPIVNAFLDASLVRDTRDNALDPRRGRFLGFNVSASPRAIGSDVRFAKAFAQGFFVKAFDGSWLWAQGYRLGLAKGFAGQEVYPDDRFTAGGANSVRGYATDSLGPRNDFGVPLGGDAVVIVNEELRYRWRLGLGFALFYDAGNVFDRVAHLSFDLKHALGFGLRWESPVGLLRVDMGFPLNPEPGTDTRPADAAYQLFFSLGQAF